MAGGSLEKKRCRLVHLLQGYDGLLVAFSGGVDSSFLLAAARQVLGNRVTAVTAESPVHPLRERQAAADLARALQVDHIIIQSHEMDLPEFQANPANRCYICKKHVFGALFDIAAERGRILKEVKERQQQFTTATTPRGADSRPMSFEAKSRSVVRDWWKKVMGG